MSFTEAGKARESGLVMLEFTLVLPVMVLLILGAFEFSRALQRQQIAAALSREAASIGYRECLADPAGDPKSTWHDSDFRLSSIQECLALPREQVRKIAEKLVGESQIELGVFRGNSPSLTADFYTPSSGMNTSRFSRTGTGGSVSRGTTTLNSRDYLIVAEVYVPFPALFKFIWQAMGQNPKEFYDATVM